MTTSTKLLAAAALAASLGLSAGSALAWGCGSGCGYGPGMMNPGCGYAQGVNPGCGYGPGVMHQRHHARGGQPCWVDGQQGQFRAGPRSFEERKIYLRGALDLTDAQKPAFDAYVGAVEAYHSTPRPALAQGANRQDVLNARIEFHKARLASLEKVSEARQALVKVLKPEQLKVLDTFESRSHRRVAQGGFQGPRGPMGQQGGFRGPMGPQGGAQPAPQAQGGTL